MKNRTHVRLFFLLAFFILSSQLYALQIVAGPCLRTQIAQAGSNTELTNRLAKKQSAVITD